MRYQLALVAALLTCACGGRLAYDADAGDAQANDANTGDGNVAFVCGEGNKTINCDPTTQYCLLIRSAHSRAYSCNPLPPACTGSPASAPGDCGCFTGPDGEIYMTVCQ